MQKIPVKHLTREWVTKRLPKRPQDANKGTFGKILVIAGSENFPGAAYLCCAAAYRVGTGLVTLVSGQQVEIIVSRKLPEVTFLAFDEAFAKIKEFDALLIGPGLGQNKQTAEFIEKLLEKELPKTIIDADGLNILSKMGKWWEQLRGEIILTPHSGEMARLTGKTIEEIQKDRVNVAQYYAKKWRKVIVLKGANTVVASPEGGAAISPFANPALATAGTGDILAGVIAGMLAQGLKLYDAAAVGVYIHGQTGEMLREKIGQAGSLAGDLLPFLPLTIKQLSSNN